MNYRLVCRLLGLITILIAFTMVFSLPWAFPVLGIRHGLEHVGSHQFEANGFNALVATIGLSVLLAGVLFYIGRGAKGDLYQREAMAVVGLTWVFATILGGLPFYIGGTVRGPSARIGETEESQNYVYVCRRGWWRGSQWIPKFDLSYDERNAVAQLIQAGPHGIPHSDPRTEELLGIATSLASKDADFLRILRLPESLPDQKPLGIHWLAMSFVDALFESQSGFSTTGATVISELEDPRLVPHCILFWRSSTHLLGGLGIIVLFVAILGHGSAGKALMRNEVPGPSQDGAQARMQHGAWVFAGIYVGLNVVLTILLKVCGLTWFDALCHAFGTMATGGFSTYNASAGHFNSALIDYILVAFMFLAGMNFTLIYFAFLGYPAKMWRDVEWRAYAATLVVSSCVVIGFGYAQSEFTDASGQRSWFAATRYGLFQVVSVMTTTGYGTHDFDTWNSLSKCVLLILMFVGGCAGSTGGGIKVIRWVLLGKILGLELERAHHPRVVRPLRLGDKVIENDALPKNILVYFATIGVIFLASWLFVVGIEPDSTWAGNERNKLLDSASAVAATLNNIGPGLGTVGATRNYGHLCESTKFLFTLLMMLGRVEVFAILVLILPDFWKSR